MSWVQDKKVLQELARMFDKSVVLHTKDNWLCKLIAWFLFIVTFGKFKREKFMKNWAIAIANHQFYPEGWASESVKRLIPHESRHTWQFRILGFNIHPLVGLPLGLICYAFLLLPVLQAWIRFFMELDANMAYWKYNLKYPDPGEDVDLQEMQRKAEVFAKKVTSYKYAWSLPTSWAKKIARWGAEKVYNEQL